MEGVAMLIVRVYKALKMNQYQRTWSQG